MEGVGFYALQHCIPPFDKPEVLFVKASGKSIGKTKSTTGVTMRDLFFYPFQITAPINRICAILAALALMMTACSDTGQGAATTTTTDDSATTTTTEPTTTTTSTTTTLDPPAEDGLGATERCTNPEGFSIDYPADWSVNDGSVVSACSLFDPEPFVVPESTDARVADISAYIDDIAFSRLAAPDADDDLERAVTSIDGHQAVRLTGETSGDGLYPDGIPFTRYVIDLGAGPDEQARSMTIDILGFDGVDYERGRTVLDLMVRTMEFNTGDTNPAVVARYGGGGTPFTVLAETEARELCLSLEGADGEACLGPIGQSAPIRSVNLGDGLQPILAGILTRDAFRIEARMSDGGASSYLPVPVIGGDEVSAWAFPFGPADLTELVWYDLDGDELGSRKVARPGEDEAGPDAVGEFTSDPVSTADFPASGRPSYLTDLRVGAHDGFDRIVFAFDGGGDLSYRVEETDQVLQISGEPIAVEGDILISVTITPASGVDLSGSEPNVIYSGPDRWSPPSTRVIEELARVSDFESTLVWAIGVSDGAEFAVDVLDDRQRLVIDVRS
ncbi:MAG: hypothetical protein KJO36_00900 [Acidimicrobiia bacterium]|nr:hypothetical protein [Acidimicrobiia bacterium]